jgi:DnaJ-class molecular chaperone
MAAHRDRPLADWYAQLEVSTDASTAEIDAAYRRLARALHPDATQRQSVDVERLQLVLEAHDILSNPARRRTYDELRGLRRTMPAPRESRHCPVCRGARFIATPCSRCGATGYQSSTSPWLRTVRRCPGCQGTGRRATPCGACAATGRTTHPDPAAP